MQPPISPAESFATLIRCLSGTVAARTGWGLALPLIALIIGRLRRINQRFSRLAARVGAGTYVLRRSAAPRRPPETSRPRQPSGLPQKFGWLLPLVPEAIGYIAQLERMLGDPEMAALMAAAPASLGRPLRSLCWMLRVRPPPILAPPAKPRPKRTAPAAAPAPRPPPPERTPPPQAPEWLRTMPGGKPWSLARIRGPRHRG